MELTKLFEVQQKLDEEIERKHPTQPGEDRLAKRILALQVELGELANEWRGFKFWSTDQEPRTCIETGICIHCAGTGNIFYDDEEEDWEDCSYCNGEGEELKNPLLEEYVDCLHFILSIGLAIDEEYFYLEEEMKPEKDVVTQFQKVFQYAHLITEDDYCSQLLTSFVYLGEMLGFTWEQIEEAYMSKNQTNWERQNNGY